MIDFILSYYLYFIIGLILMPSAALCSSILQNTLNGNKKLIKQKFELVSLTFYSLFSLIGVFFSFYLLDLTIKIFNEVLKQDYISTLLFIFLLLLIFIISLGLLICSICFFKHLHFESIRNVYFEKETNIIHVIQNKKNIIIDLKDTNNKITVFSTNLRTLPGVFGKYTIENNEIKVDFSKILNFTPELEEVIIKFPNKTIINKNYNWI